MKRKSKNERTTNETDIKIELELASLEKSVIDSGVPFFDHMLNSMSKHGRFYLNLECNGDVQVDDHHTVEDIGIAFGKAFKKALGNKEGIKRFGDATIPMDDALAMVAVDLSGRAHYKYSGPELKGYIKKYSEELTTEFLRAFAIKGEINLHVVLMHGDNSHHIHESIFKALGVALYKAVSIDPFLNGEVLSTKGMIV
ncbi:imidazoleglycerol-phosphate dehydratase HisB [Spirochaetota bacterium]